MAFKFLAYHVVPDSPQMERDFLEMLASLAACSEEMIPRDILQVAKTNGILPVQVTGFQEFPDKGAGGLVQFPKEHRPRAVVVGRRAFIQECGLQIPDILEVTARRWEAEPGHSIALGGWDGWVRGVLKFSVTKT